MVIYIEKNFNNNTNRLDNFIKTISFQIEFRRIENEL